MKNIVPKDSKYIPLAQEKWSCVPACVQMILLRHNLKLMPSQLIAHYLNLTIHPEDIKYFWNIKSGPKPKSGYGTKIYETDALNKFIKKFKLPLSMSWNLIDNFTNLEEFGDYFKRKELQDNDILVCFDWGTLLDEDYHGGHICLLDKVNLVKKEVRLIDPGQNAPKWRIVKMSKLYKAMLYHGKDKSGGFWEFIRTKTI